MQRLTTPQEMDLVRRLYPTGNHFVSLPVVAAKDAAIDRVGVLHQGTVSLMELGGPQAELGAETLPPLEPLLRPFVERDGKKVPLEGGLTWKRRWAWVPTFEWRDPDSGLGLRGTIFAPVWRDSGELRSHKGFVYVMEMTDEGAGGPPPLPGGPPASPAPHLRLGLTLTWGDLIQTVYASRRVPAELTVRADRWTGGPVLEPRSGAGGGPAAMAVAFSVPQGEVAWSSRTEAGGLARLEMAAGPAGGRSVAFYFGLAREGDGARTVAVDLSRRGWQALLAETGEALGPMRRRLEGPPDGERAVLEERLNLNLLFNYFFAVGRTIDTEELALVTSRSPLYYVSAAFWARDALLWSFPGLLLADPLLAEEAIGAAFDRYFRHAGTHSLYLDGTLLYPGFELDELAAYPVALWRYVRATGDKDVLHRRGLVPKLHRLLGLLESWRCPDPGVHLYRTFLLPSDDPASQPYVTYDNVLAWRALLCAADLLEWGGAGSGPARDAPATPVSLRAEADLVRASILRHCVVRGPSGPLFAWSVDLEGGAEVGDEPPGSLELLPYYGFCPRDDEVWLNTMRWSHSPGNPYRYAGVPFPGLGCQHAEHPFVMSLFNALLGGLEERIAEARGVLARAPLDTGLACEAYDRETGEVKTGAAFASCAGFLAYAMDRVLGIHGENRNGARFVE